MPERYHQGRNKGRHFNNSAGQARYYNNGPSYDLSSYSENLGFGQQSSMIQITSISDIAAIGGFNPNKYLSPMPPPPVYLDGMPLTNNQDNGMVSAFQAIPNVEAPQQDQKVSTYPGQKM